ncbi:penicillin-binding protein 1A [Rickettsiales endosymbiont of Trichoplax sp. H2]|uniref:penicillin-binding protein 1A n=1 Tax=Rickettsiales endosymbiont of Trichoplax sp. H2 TaxID=2021221 RepID=UPI0012B256BE|nr:PBP1A family penicillin-binding protein [Rickettsiales endosymbiont of Trichoplax sp. H2]MSO13822.1 Penicillin-binding protein 1A [Rickettsiales endosymbiont of Trichoplax sp. H2]
MKKLAKKFFILLSIISAFTIGLVFLCLIFLSSFFYDIPNYEELSNYLPSGITRLYSPNGKILDEYSLEKRIYVKYKDIPKVILDAFIAVEDKNFFEHQGIDITSIIRASLQNILNIGTNKRLVGGSTITQQVVKGFFLTSERSLTRKLKEAVLAYRVSKAFSKEKILEIYLNQIYLGHHSYGIYVAAQNYFGKKLTEINIQEAALLASLPKAPSTLNPYKNYNRALERRNWAIQRMEEEGFISFNERVAAINSDIKLSYSPIRNNQFENFYTSAVRSELIELFGENELYSNAFIVNTNINLNLQNAAQQALRAGLKKFDKKQGYRGAFATTDLNNNYINDLKSIYENSYHDSYILGVVVKVNNENINVVLQDKNEITLTKSSFDWILNSRYSLPKQLKQNFKLGDVILLNKHNNIYKLEQIPEINGAIVVIENISGKILALVGGYDYKQSKFNRVIQAKRQPGSAFKTFVYLAAFEQGISPNTLVLDEPLEIDLGHGLPIWKPKNYGNKYYGLITLRTSFEKSRNLSTLRLLLGIGLDRLAEVAKRYLIYNSNIKPNYSMALGSYETTLLKITNAYASIANNGNMKQPKLIDSVYDRHGKLLYSPKDLYYKINQDLYFKDEKSSPTLGFLGKKVTDDATNYQILSLLEGVVKRGSARRANALNRTVAGKTGTTNNSLDTWFIGMTPDITVGVFVGYDIPKDMGKYAAGSNIPLPIFVDFFQKLKFIPNRNFEIPESIAQNFIDQETGDVVDEKDFTQDKKYILENFKNAYTESAVDSSHLNIKKFDDIDPDDETNNNNSIFDLLQNEDNESLKEAEDLYNQE